MLPFDWLGVVASFCCGFQLLSRLRCDSTLTKMCRGPALACELKFSCKQGRLRVAGTHVAVLASETRAILPKESALNLATVACGVTWCKLGSVNPGTVYVQVAMLCNRCRPLLVSEVYCEVRTTNNGIILICCSMCRWLRDHGSCPVCRTYCH